MKIDIEAINFSLIVRTDKQYDINTDSFLKKCFAIRFGRFVYKAGTGWKSIYHKNSSSCEETL